MLMNGMARKAGLAGLMGLMVLAGGCEYMQTTDPYTGQTEVNKTTKGAAIGAATGVAIGLITGNDSAQRKKNALILGGVGAVAGGAVGNYMDRQDAALRARLQGTGVSVTRTGPKGENITLNMPGNITFAVNSGDINSSFYPVLDSVALVLKEFDKTMVEVAGHTDSDGSDSYNQLLSEKRANSVVAYLTSRDLRADRFIAVGAGESRPIASNATPEGKAQNRRVEITIVPLTAN
ncbi:putative lipoprotein YiaD [Gammaproteobacteria bacterium]|nr:putative lipoprotein YiaD [Gammaproteobacteria bacterium]